MTEVHASIEYVSGFRVAGVHSGLKKDDLLDMALIVSDAPCTAAGVFTTNYMKAAPVLFDMEQLQNNKTHIRASGSGPGREQIDSTPGFSPRRPGRSRDDTVGRAARGLCR